MSKEVNSPGLITQMLKQAKDNKGNSLFEHLNEFLSRVDSQSKDSFEFLSDFFKKHKFTSESINSAEEVKRLQQLIKQQNQWKVKASALLSEVKISKKHKYLYKPLTQTIKLFDWAGISFGNKETYLLDNSIKKLAETVDAKNLRFWGKIFTRKQDYFVAQGISLKKNKTDVKDNVEKAGVGVNQITYWVTHNYLDEWIQLPLVTPQQVQISRLINYIFTGDLNADVQCYPSFPGKEKHLLKAQIARITHGCQICPEGLLSESTEEGVQDEVEFSEDFSYPQFFELKNLEKWVHINKYILKQGRATHYVDQKLPQEERDAAIAQFDQTGEKKARLGVISEDKLIQGQKQQPYWFTRVYGDTQTFRPPSDDESAPQSVYAITAVKSLLWPGWTTVSSKDDFASIYVGYGLKQGQQILSPMSPQNLGVQGEDQDEYPQPNPKEPLDELEPDSDDENKQQEDQS